MRRRRSTASFAWIVGAAALAAALAAVLMDERGSGEAVSRPPSAALLAPQLSQGVMQPSRTDDSATIRLSPPYEVADGLTILTQTQRIRLSGLDGPAAEAVCYDPAERLWACGLQARAALTNLIRNQAVTCRTTGQRWGAAVVAECSVGSTRLDRALVGDGMARPAGDATTFQQEMTSAKADGRGLWMGGWRIRP